MFAVERGLRMQAKSSKNSFAETFGKKRLWIIGLLSAPLLFLSLVKIYYMFHPLQIGFVLPQEETIFIVESEDGAEGTSVTMTSTVSSTSASEQTG